MTNATFQSGIHRTALLLSSMVWVVSVFAMVLAVSGLNDLLSIKPSLPTHSIISATLLLLTTTNLLLIQLRQPPLLIFSLLIVAMALVFSLLIDYQPILSLPEWLRLTESSQPNDSPQSLLILSLSLLALLFLQLRREQIAHTLAIINLCFLMMIFFSYAHRGDEFHYFTHRTGVALVTASLCYLLNWAIIFTQHNASFFALLSSPDIDGRIARVTFSLCIIVPVVISWITVIIPSNDFVSPHDFSIILSPLLLLAAIVLILRLAINLAKAERMRQKAEQEALAHQAHLAHVARLHVMHELTTGIAHELNQPLAAIKNYSAAGHNFLNHGTDSRIHMSTLFTHIQEQAERAAEIIRQLRSFIKKSPQVKKTADLNQLVRNVSRLLGGELSNRQIYVRYHLAHNLPLVDMDPTQIEQVIVNLIQNAIDAMAETPVSRRILTLRTYQTEANRIQCDISDHGSGISEELQSMIFDSFVSTKDEMNGLGIGLSLCRSLIESHHGALWLESSSPEGSMFSFYLPVKNDD